MKDKNEYRRDAKAIDRLVQQLRHFSTKKLDKACDMVTCLCAYCDVRRMLAEYQKHNVSWSEINETHP